MNSEPGIGNPSFARMKVTERLQFDICYGMESDTNSDPVADQYRVGSLDHMRSLVDIALATLQPGDRVLDLGAHLGGFALTAAAIGCQVMAVEASPRNAELLRLSIAQNKFEKMAVIHAAVSDQNGSLEFSVLGPFGHIATPKTGLPSISVPAVTIDDLLEQRQWDNVRFIKMDIEGAEVQAMGGMQKLLRQSAAPIFFFESNQHTLAFYEQTDKVLKSQYRRCGYTVYGIGRKKLLRVNERTEQSATVKDYLAAKTLPPSLALWERSANSLFARVGRQLGLLKQIT